MEKAQMRLAQKQQAQARQQIMGAAWQEALQSQGLTPQEYAQLEAQDPQAAAATTVEGMKQTVSRVAATKREPQPGQLVKQTQIPQAQPRQAPAQGDRQEQLRTLREESQAKDSDLDAMLAVLLPDDDPMVNYSK